MATETTNTTKKTTTKKGDKDKDAAGKAAGYAAIFADWEFIPGDEELRDVPLDKIKNIFDVRTSPGDVSKEFVKSCSGGLLEPPGVIEAKYLGPDDAKLRLTTGNTYYVVGYGRKRLNAAEKLGWKAVKCLIKRFPNWGSLVGAAAVENAQRQNMSQWDMAYTIYNMKTGGLTNGTIATEIGLSEGYVSQYLGVFEMPEEVQAYVKAGSISVTFLRRLRPLSDEADQIAMAKTCIEKGWTEAELQEAIEKLEAKRAEKGKGPARGKGKTAPRSQGFDDVELKAMKVNDARQVLTFLDNRVRKMRAQDSDAEKVARQVGVMEGLKMAYGLKDPPKAAFTQKDEDGTDAGDDE